MVPPGVYRLGRAVSIKKSVWILGSQSRSFSRGCQIKPDPGIIAFVMEDDNRPDPPPDAAIADGAMISNLTIYNPNHKLELWQAGHTYSIGNRVKLGPPPGARVPTVRSPVPKVTRQPPIQTNEDAQGVGYSTYFRHDDFRERALAARFHLNLKVGVSVRTAVEDIEPRSAEIFNLD
jgi:hypothetical protein